MILLKDKPYSPGIPFTNDDGTQFPGNWYSLASPQERAKQGFTEVPDPTPVDQRFYYVNTDGSVTEKPIDQCKNIILYELSNIRWSKETQGIIYTSANAMFQTDSASRVNYLGVLEIAKSNSQYSTVWKARDIDDENKPKFVTISSNDIITIYQSGMDYISKCFQNEDAIVDQINSPSIKTLDQLILINTNANWPSRNY